MKQIAPNVYVSTEYAYVNVGCIVGPTGVVAVDAPTLPEDALSWRQQISELTEQPILYTALTDTHPHRLLCASLLGTPIAASREAYHHAVSYSRGFWRNAVRRLQRHHPNQDRVLRTLEPVLPGLLFTDGLTLHRAGVNVIMEPVDGAAPGSGMVRLEDTDVLFLGDTLVAGRPPVMEACPDTKAWLNTLTWLRRPRFEGTTMIPGRGPLGDQAATDPVSEYIRLARRRVRSLHRAGRPREDVVESVQELLSLFDLGDDEVRRFRRRVRNGLKQVYDEFSTDGSGG